MTCCVCAGQCDHEKPHAYCPRHAPAKSPFASPAQPVDLTLLALTIFVAALVLMLVFAEGCAPTKAGPVVAPAPASQPASLPASLPVADPRATVPRAVFDRLALDYVAMWRTKGEALADCNEALSVSKADDEAARAAIAERDYKLKMAAIFGPVGASVLATIVGVLAHYLR